MSNAIELKNLCWKAGKSFALQDVSLVVPSGCIYGFLGPNGSGKTTTIRMFMGMMKPDSGSIRVLDRSVPEGMTEILARVGYVPERPHVYPALTVSEQIRWHRSFFSRWDDAWAAELMGRLHVDPDMKISRLSKGQTGKLLILLALAQRPELLVLDEPTDGLDPVVRRDVLTATLDYVSETGATVFISSHLVHELERICDWVGVMDHGHLVAQLPMNDFKNGIKRLRVTGAPAETADAPFHLLSRARDNGTGSTETWIVRDWEDTMRSYFAGVGAELRDVVDLDLEDGFVELLRSSRPASAREE
ncbi:MAG: ABC transporter ATP-binding protein [Gemmatimonadota bacterium]|nr:ABC transporter ATP-binding protein [Gemmatimonadota bacterium]MDH5757976.1 ABC transporter ATP-binding protein [Gemmatimonadota bacterium]